VTTIVVAAITFAVGVLIGAFASAFGKTASDDDKPALCSDAGWGEEGGRRQRRPLSAFVVMLASMSVTPPSNYGQEPVNAGGI
jgi:hypothetical protein